MRQPGPGQRERSQQEIRDAAGFGLTAADLRDWPGFAPVEIAWAVRHGLAPETAARWARAGIALRDTVRAVAAGLTTEAIRPWTEAGFAPADAVEAAETGISLETAGAWREAGFILPDAAQLLRDGWTLPGAITARYHGTGRYPDPAVIRR